MIQLLKKKSLISSYQKDVLKDDGHNSSIPLIIIII